MNINLKIEILKVFCLEFSLSSDKKIKDVKDAKTVDSNNTATVKQPTAGK